MADPIILASAGLASFSHLNTLVKSFFETRDRTINLEQVNALQSEIASIYAGYLALQQQCLSLIAEKDNLKKEIARFETWEEQKKRYKLYRPWKMSSIVYALEESQSNGEPPHWICADCYEDGKRRILQCRHGKSGYEEFFCKCGAIVISHHRGTCVIPYYRAEPEAQNPKASEQEA